MNVIVNNISYSLTDRDYLGGGGQADIYVKNDIAFKVYHEAKDAIPLKKIDELSALSNDKIIKPEYPVYSNNKGKQVYIGYSMKFLQETYPICRIFTNTFQKNNNVKLDAIVSLLKKMIVVIQEIHQQQILMVDVNELNYLLDKNDLTNTYFIDVDNYQTPHFPSVAIMESYRDFHNQNFSELTDWFSFGIIAFKTFVGIHPYEGEHPKYSPNDLLGRMKDNVSVFDRQVSLPNGVRDVGNIPKEYQEWFKLLFAKGERIPPPLIATLTKIIKRVIITAQHLHFNIKLISEFKEEINFHTYYNGRDIIKYNRVINYGGKEINLLSEKEELIVSEDGTFIFINNNKNILSIRPEQKFNKIINNDFFPCKDKIIYDNQLYVINEDKFSLISFKEINNSLILSVNKSWNILPYSTQVFSNLCISDILGQCYFIIPFESSCAILPIKELNNKKIIYAKRQRNIVALVIFNGKTYDKIIVKFDEFFKQYNVRIIENINNLDLNFAVLEQGIVVFANEDQMEVFSTNFIHNEIKTIKDNSFDFINNIIVARGQRAGYYVDNKLYEISMK